MPSYRYLYGDALTDTLAGELPLESLKFGEVLNGPGALSASLPLDSAISASELVPGRTSLYIERDGVIVWGGLLWTMRMEVDTNAAELGAEGFWSLIRNRRLTDNVTFTATEQTTIAASLLTALAGKPGGDHRITPAASATGVLRDRTYISWERKNAAEAIEELAQVRDGFDFRVACRWSGSSIVREFFTSYPATGRRTEWVLDVGTNAELLSVEVDATTMVTTAHVKGEGEGTDALLATVSNASILGSYPLLEDLTAYSDVTNRSTLEAHARRRLDRGAAPVVIPSVTLYAGREPFIGSFIVGDQVRVRCSYGLIDIDDLFRITAWEAEVSDAGEAVSLTLAPLTLFMES